MARILLADDDIAVRTFARRALERHGHAVVEAGDGGSAQAAVDGDAGFQLLLSDIVMPGLDGLALAAYVRQQHPGLPIVLMTGYAAAAQRSDLEAFPDAPLLIKPFRLHTLCSTVDTLLADPTNPGSL